MLEREFLARLHRSYSRWLTTSGKRGWWFKIRDDGWQNPFDIVACLPGGRTMCIEGKLNRLKNLINMKALFYRREHELTYLIHNQMVGALCWVIIAFKGNGCAWRALAVKPEICQGMTKNGSLDVEELIDSNVMIELPGCGEGLWDLSKLFL